MQFEASRFCEAVRKVLAAAGRGERAMPLAPGGPLEGEALTKLRAMTTDDLFRGETVVSRHDARCVHAGLYLYLSALDESHAISQTAPTASGSFWHGIMHRQEQDYANAKYWFRRAGGHPAADELERRAGSVWDPFAFVDRCEAAERGGAGGERETLIALQRLEWQTLFEHCYRCAIGA